MSRRQLIALGTLTAAALALRLVHLTRFELFVDEAATWWFARLIAAGGLFEVMSLEPTPPLYYLSIGFLMRLFGDSVFVLRLPSAIFGAAAIPIVFALGRALFGRRIGWLAALLLALHPLHVFYSREARVYTLLLCLTMCTLLALWRALSSDSRRAWIIFSAALIAVCYSHFYGLFLAASAAVAILAWGRGGRARMRGLIAVTVALLAFAPYLAMTLPHLKTSGAAWSVDSFYRDYPRDTRFGRVLEVQLIGADYHPYLRQLDRPPTPGPLRASSLLAQLILLVVALRFAAARDRLGELGFLTAGWLVPILLPWAISQFGRAIFHPGRHDFYTLGGLCVLLAVGLDGLLLPCARLRLRKVVVAAILATIAASAVFRLAALHRVMPGGYQLAAGEWLAEHARPDDRVMAMGIRRLVTEYHAGLGGCESTFESFPASTDDHPGWSDVMTLIGDQETLHREARDRIEKLGRQMASHDTLFLLLRSYERTADAVSATWLVDRHVLENLWHAGWRRVPEASSEAARVDAYRPPESSRPDDTGGFETASHSSPSGETSHSGTK